jgi:phosphopantetheinyl transferase (holo-ACP synthase)
MAEFGVVLVERGLPRLPLTGRALERMAEAGANAAHLSLTHDAGVAAAVCVLE